MHRETKMLDKDAHIVFLSYATPDRERVLPYHDWLRQTGLNVWIDCRAIKPGQNWDFEIRRALDKASVVVAFISQNSFSRRGYVQREIKLALDKLSEKLIDDIYIVPVLLDENVEIPDQLKGIQCIAASNPECKREIADALTYQFGRLGIDQQRTQRMEDVYWSFSILREAWDGLPGYEVEIQLPSFASERYPNVSEIGEYLRGRFLRVVFQHRSDRLTQAPHLFNHAQDKFQRINTYDAHCAEPSIKGKVLTVQYAVHWYGAGAAHPNHHFETFSFLLEPLVGIRSLEEIFSEPVKSLTTIQEHVRSELRSVRLDDGTEQGGTLDAEWIDRGTSEWRDFRAFVFRQETIDFLFAPYQVGAYACGPQFATVSYDKVAPQIRREFRSALGIEHLARG